MNIYDKTGSKKLDVLVTRQAKHEEEMMRSNFVQLSWNATTKIDLDAGTYIIPFNDGVKYRLLDKYHPKQERENKFVYTPQFQHPIMILDKIPFILVTGNTTSFQVADKETDWTYTGTASTILQRIVDTINIIGREIDDIGTGWIVIIDSDLSGSKTCQFSSTSVMGGVTECANQWNCEYHFDYENKILYFGKVVIGDAVTLKVGENIGVPSINTTTQQYYNAYIVKGSTRNISQKSTSGSNVSVNRRLTLDPAKYPYGYIDLRTDKSEPLMLGEIILDDIYPSLDLYVYDARCRTRNLLDDDGEVVTDLNGRPQKYAVWYIRLAYFYNGQWMDYVVTDDQLIDGLDLSISFQANEEDGALPSPLAGRDFGLTFHKQGQDIPANESDGDSGVIIKAGDYEIIFEDGNPIVPTTEDGELYPRGGSSPSLLANRVLLYNVAMSDAYKKQAYYDLEQEGLKEIARLRSDLNNYTFQSNAPVFEDYRTNPNLSVGQKVLYDDGQGYTYETRVMKLVTQIDKPYQQTITIGNEQIKGTNTKIREDIQRILTGGGGTSSDGSGTGGNVSDLKNLISAYGKAYFLSKKHSDYTPYSLGIGGNLTVGGDTTIDGLMRVMKAYINILQSANYSGGSMEDVGWQLTSDYNGHSKLTVDELYVRMKAVFEELEVRKWTYVGGNFILSAAGSRVCRVDYLDQYGEKLGYAEYDVPWALFGNPFALRSPEQENRYNNFLLGSRKRIKRMLTDEEWDRVVRYRCYLFTDDGTTQTMNWWKVGDQAKCQTFNRVKDKIDSDGSFSGRAENTYYWRLVEGVGSEKLEDGKYYDYIDLSTTDYDKSITNDIPVPGDALVQMGHRTLKERQNMITLEVIGEDAPAIKEYKGINSYSLANKRKTMISPTSGNEFYATKFVIVTEYGDNTVPTDRGLWVDIVPDEDGNRRCYYYDRVAHNGCLWLCIIPDTINIYNKEGEVISQAEFENLTKEEQERCTRGRNYTTDEPSEDSQAWQKQVSSGIMPYVELSDQLVPVACEKGGTASEAFRKTVTVKLKLTNLECQITSVTLEGADAHVKQSGNDIAIVFAKNDAVTNKDYNITVSGKLNGQSYTASTKLCVYAIVRGDDAYDITVTPSHFIFGQNEEEPYQILIDGGQTGNGSALIEVKKDGEDQPFTILHLYPSQDGINAAISSDGKRVYFTYIRNNIESGWVDAEIRYGNNSVVTLRIPFYCNLLGTWKQKIIGDTEKVIADKVKYFEKDLEETKQLIEDNKRDFEAANKELEDLIKANKDAQDSINKIVEDGIITAEEKGALKALRMSLKAEYDEVIASYVPVYNNEYLTDETVKANLLSAKNTLVSTYNNVDNELRILISYDTVDPSKDLANLNSAFTAFDAALAAFRAALESARASIDASIDNASKTRYQEFHAEYERSSQRVQEQFTQISGYIDDINGKIVTQTDFANYKRSATESLSTLETNVYNKFGEVDQKFVSERRQTSQEISDAVAKLPTFQSIEDAKAQLTAAQKLITDDILAVANGAKDLANAAQNAADTAQNTANNAVNKADNADTKAQNAMTWINTNKNRFNVISGSFDADGKLTRTAGLVVDSGTGSNSFVTLFAQRFADSIDGYATTGYVDIHDSQVRLGVNTDLNNTGIDITEGKIHLGGNTVIDGTLTINNQSEKGFLLVGNNGTMTAIQSVSIGTYDNFVSKSGAIVDLSVQMATQLSNRWGVWNGSINIDVPNTGVTIYLRNQRVSFSTPSGSNISYSDSSFYYSYHLYDPYGREISGNIEGGQSSISGLVGSIYISSGYPAGQYRLEIEIENSLSTNASSAICTVNVNCEIPANTYMLIGNDGLAANFGSNKSAYIGKDNTVFRYGNYGFKIDSSNGLQMLKNGAWVTLATSDGTSQVTSISWNNVTNKPSWIGTNKPSYTASEVGAAAANHSHSYARYLGISSGNLYIYDASWNYLHSVALPSASSVDWANVTNKPSTMPNYYNLYWRYGTNDANFSDSQASGTYDGSGSSRYIAIPTVSLSGRVITINGSSITVPESGGSASGDYLPISGGTLTGGLRLKRTDTSYGIQTRLNFGDGEEVYMEEHQDGYFKIHVKYSLTFDLSTSNKIYIGNTTDAYIQPYDAGSWGKGILINGNDIEIGGSYHISLYTNASSSYLVLNRGSITSTSISQTSDQTMKDEIDNLKLSVEDVANAPLVRFTFKHEIEKAVHFGTYAQYWQNVLPESVVASLNPVTNKSQLGFSYAEAGLASAIVACREILIINSTLAQYKSRIERLEEELQARSEDLERRISAVERQAELLTDNMYNN